MTTPRPSVQQARDGAVAIVTIDRPQRRNAVDSATATALADAVERADTDPGVAAIVLTGSDGVFCAGADLQALAAGDRADASAEGGEGRGPMGPTRMRTMKPVIAAIEGPAVAGGLELALWADLRVAARDAVFGVYCRRFGVPLIDLGTVRLPRLIGHSRAMDLILTGRGIDGVEAERIGLVNRLTEPGEALPVAVALAHELAALPQECLRHDRLSALEQWDLSEEDAWRNEWRHGTAVIGSGETLDGAARFSAGAGRHGSTT
ncbi:crotonase/enoyl-CoA hydratase family protein [Nocardioides sp. R-C-SC26]|uniref:crotonase/enoyl-CoA hydratase family protein n=1 Tax=Nocardioides sp. R-C-SC26 TaxID=2870414 RepID=UPI001E4B6B47|nr:crotonase/enoyl-CoA hydratase family protein [Nocardioides sp. R-C-SC26]